MKTFSIKQSQIEKKWHLIDAEGLVLGRLASRIANLIRGKHKVEFTPHMDCGDHVVVINAEKVSLTGNKRMQEKFYWHTGYPGGIKNRTLDQILSGAHPERVLLKAVERMISKGPLREQQMGNLHVYKGAEHPHQAQGPALYDFASQNRKNTY